MGGIGGKQRRVVGGIDVFFTAIAKSQRRMGEYKQVMVMHRGHVVDKIGGMYGIIADHVDAFHGHTTFGEVYRSSRCDYIKTAYAAVVAWIEANGYEPSGAMFNIYHVSPHETQNPDAFVTEICYVLNDR